MPSDAAEDGPSAEEAIRPFGSSPFAKLRAETNQSPEVRQSIIASLEKRLGKAVFTFFKSFQNQESQIDDNDAEMLESMLATEHDGSGIVLVINSPGGQALAAERIANVCRNYSGGDFEVIVPHMAKSAATMICFAASKIYMSRTGELGPVDPQVVYKRGGDFPMYISADEYVRSYDDLMKKATSAETGRLEALLQQLARYDARYVEQLRSAQSLAADISIRLLKSGMHRDENEKSIKEKIKIFLAQSQKRSHGRMINFDEAVDCGLNLEEIHLRSALWNDVWDLFVRSDWIVNARCEGIIESKGVSLFR